jgi:hypothetical protein
MKLGSALKVLALPLSVALAAALVLIFDLLKCHINECVSDDGGLRAEAYFGWLLNIIYLGFTLFIVFPLMLFFEKKWGMLLSAITVGVCAMLPLLVLFVRPSDGVQGIAAFFLFFCVPWILSGIICMLLIKHGEKLNRAQ